MATRLFVGNLPENTSETDLRLAFSPYGEITTLDLKRKAAEGNESKNFAFISLSGSNYDIESCIKHFTNEEFNGNRLYVTRARESFLERLQKERLEAQQKEKHKHQQEELPKINPKIKLDENLNPRKRNYENVQHEESRNTFHENSRDFGKQVKKTHIDKQFSKPQSFPKTDYKEQTNNSTSKIDNHIMEKLDYNQINNSTSMNEIHVIDEKKQSSENKRIESMKKKRQEFKEKQQIIKSGLTAVDKPLNSKIVFDDEDILDVQTKNTTVKQTGSLFDGEDSDDEVDFSIKKQYEGKQGQKVLDLQSRYKSDKRFTLDERFLEEEGRSSGEDSSKEDNEDIEIEQKDEKNKQLDILQDVLGITLKRKQPQDDNAKNKPIRGMLRFDPSQPEHAKFLTPVELKQETNKKGKKKLKDAIQEDPKPEEVRPEVSKEQFYKVSETLKEAIAQPAEFSLRSLFGNSEQVEDESKEEQNYTHIEAPKKPKVKNPFETKEKNPFVYDSSESENEEEPETKTDIMPAAGEVKAVWKENLFFSDADQRLKEGLAFFSNVNEETQKERRELKSLVKKRIYNKDRKNQMFKKKIGGRRKTMKRSFRKNP